MSHFLGYAFCRTFLCFDTCSTSKHCYDMTQASEMQIVLNKGLAALSVHEMGQVLSHLGLNCFVANFKNNGVGVTLYVFVS